MVTGPRAHGINVALPGYTLGPDARMTEIVAEIRQSLTYLAEHADDLGFDRSRLYVGGWSAGGHLTAAVADHPAVRGAMPISGIFDLEPISLGVLNDKLSLSAEGSSKSNPTPQSPPPPGAPGRWGGGRGTPKTGGERGGISKGAGGERGPAGHLDARAGTEPFFHHGRVRQTGRRPDAGASGIDCHLGVARRLWVNVAPFGRVTDSHGFGYAFSRRRTDRGRARARA